MFYVYFLKSVEKQEFYIGYTNNLRRRFAEHNNKLVRSTKSKTPYKLVYYEAYLSEVDARRRESSLKLRGQARRQVLERIRESSSERKES